MLDQRKAMQHFDRTATHGSQLLEAQLILIGLPTLGDAVRPQIGRRGQPLKQRPVDLHPDLVEQVRAVGMIRLDDRELRSLSSTETADAGGIGGAYAVLSQTGATASSASKLGRVRRAASDWWEKLRPVA